MKQYRGLTKDGKWVYGWYAKAKTCSIIIPQNCHVYEFLSNGIEVIPETVGQSTGLHDKNNKEIYEGDIVSVPRYKCKANLQIYWNTEIAAFEGLHSEGAGSECFDELNEPEIIGTIHDTPKESE